MTKINSISTGEVVEEEATLHKLWPTITYEEKRRIIENITERITLYEDEINISLCSLPSSEELIKRQQTLSN